MTERALLSSARQQGCHRAPLHRRQGSTLAGPVPLGRACPRLYLELSHSL